jgi:hypothetical protein
MIVHRERRAASRVGAQVFASEHKRGFDIDQGQKHQMMLLNAIDTDQGSDIMI